MFIVIKILLEGDFQNGTVKSATVPCQQNIHIVKTIIQSLQKASSGYTASTRLLKKIY